MTDKNEKVACPECGGLYSKRGLGSHRYYKHTSAARTSRGSARISDALVASEGRPASAEVYATLTTLCTWLQRVESRLANMEALAHAPALVGAPGIRVGPPEAEIDHLRTELDQVLEDIAEAKQEQSEGPEDPGEAQNRLGELRLRQAQILMRMGPDAPGALGPGLLALL